MTFLAVPYDACHRLAATVRFPTAAPAEPEERLMSATRRRVRAAVAAVGAIALVAACGSDDSGEDDGEGGPLVVWTLENLPDRVAAQEEIAAAFTEESGIEVDLVAIDEDQFNQLLTSSAAAGELPDV